MRKAPRESLGIRCGSQDINLVLDMEARHPSWTADIHRTLDLSSRTGRRADRKTEETSVLS